jgi:hypothetical protein
LSFSQVNGKTIKPGVTGFKLCKFGKALSDYKCTAPIPSDETTTFQSLIGNIFSSAEEQKRNTYIIWRDDQGCLPTSEEVYSARGRRGINVAGHSGPPEHDGEYVSILAYRFICGYKGCLMEDPYNGKTPGEDMWRKIETIETTDDLRRRLPDDGEYICKIQDLSSNRKFNYCFTRSQGTFYSIRDTV